MPLKKKPFSLTFDHIETGICSQDGHSPNVLIGEMLVWYFGEEAVARRDYGKRRSGATFPSVRQKNKNNSLPRGSTALFTGG